MGMKLFCMHLEWHAWHSRAQWMGICRISCVNSYVFETDWMIICRMTSLNECQPLASSHTRLVDGHILVCSKLSRCQGQITRHVVNRKSELKHFRMDSWLPMILWGLMKNIEEWHQFRRMDKQRCWATTNFPQALAIHSMPAQSWLKPHTCGYKSTDHLIKVPQESSNFPSSIDCPPLQHPPSTGHIPVLTKVNQYVYNFKYTSQRRSQRTFSKHCITSKVPRFHR